MDFARATWELQQWVEHPVHEDGMRMFHDGLGKAPYIKDVLRVASASKSADDILVFSNSDICCSPDCSTTLAAALQGPEAVYCRRRDFNRLTFILPKDLIPVGTQYPGIDLFAFRVRWWTEYSVHFPDMLLGRESWDPVFMSLVELTNEGLGCEIMNMIYHEAHYSPWQNPSLRHRMPSQLYNLALSKKWLAEHNINLKQFGL
jgi:hypothetical protein